MGPHKSAVVLFDRGYPSFGNVDSTIAIDVVGMKSYMFLKTKCMRLHTTLRHSPFIRFFNLLWNRTCIKEEFNFSMKIIKCFSVVKLLERYVKGEHESRPKRKTRSTRESNLLRRENTSKESFASCNS